MHRNLREQLSVSSEETLEGRMFSVANKLRRIDEIPHRFLVVDYRELYPSFSILFHPHDFHELRETIGKMLFHPGKIDATEVPKKVREHIQDALSQGSIVVIDDRSHGEVLGIEQEKESGSWKVVKKNRYSGETFKADVQNPRLQTEFTEGGNITISVSEANGAKTQRARGKQLTQISSDGPFRARGFTVVASKRKDGKAEEEVILGFVDVKESLTEAYEYRGKSSWMVKGPPQRINRQ